MRVNLSKSDKFLYYIDNITERSIFDKSKSKACKPSESYINFVKGVEDKIIPQEINFNTNTKSKTPSKSKNNFNPNTNPNPDNISSSKKTSSNMTFIIFAFQHDKLKYDINTISNSCPIIFNQLSKTKILEKSKFSSSKVNLNII